MPISIISTGQPNPNTPGQEAQAPNIFFNNQSTSNTSATFLVDKEPWYLQAFNLGASDTVTIQMASGIGSATTFANLAVYNGPVQLTATHNKIRLDYPGRYRLVYAGADNVSTVLVVGYPGTMTHETTGALEEALAAVVKTFYTTVTQINGVSPVLVAGAGTVLDPYVISLSTAPGTAPPNFVEVQGVTPIAVAGTGTAGAPYTVSANLAVNADMEAGTSTTTLINPAELTHIVSANSASGITQLGVGAVATGTQVTAVGAGATTANNFSVAVGAASSTLGLSCVALGYGANTTASSCTAVGAGAAAHAVACTAIGSATASGIQSTAVGSGAVTLGANAIAIGQGAVASTESDIYVGRLAGNGHTHVNAIVISSPVVSTSTPVNTTQDNQIVIGNSSHTQLVTAGSVIQGGAISASDARLKVNVKDLMDPVKKIDKLFPVTFMWDEEKLDNAGLPHLKSDMSFIHSGLIAQELEQVFPECIGNVTGTDGVEYKFVHYDRLIPTMLGAIQELSMRLKNLENSRI